MRSDEIRIRRKSDGSIAIVKTGCVCVESLGKKGWFSEIFEPIASSGFYPDDLWEEVEPITHRPDGPSSIRFPHGVPISQVLFYGADVHFTVGDIYPNYHARIVRIVEEGERGSYWAVIAEKRKEGVA